MYNSDNETIQKNELSTKERLVKSNLSAAMKKLVDEMFANETTLCDTKDMSLPHIVQLSKRQNDLGMSYQYLSRVFNTRFPQPHQQQQPLKPGIVDPNGLEPTK